MVDFRAGYVEPGVYVSSDTSGSAAAVGVSGTVVCLVGKGLGYNIYTERVSFTGGNVVALTRQGIDPDSVVVSGTITVGGVPTQTTFIANAGGTPHDYSVSQTGSGTAATASLSRTTSGGIPSGGTVLVSYHYTDPTYFALNSFSDYSSFEDAYGVPFDPATGEIQSELSLAAQLAYQNGARVIYAVALSGSGSQSAQLQSALALTLSNYDINIVVPLNNGVNDGSAAQNMASVLAGHLQAAENDGLYRIGIFGVDRQFQGVTPDVLAKQSNYRRIVLVWPQTFLYYNSLINMTQVLAGYFFAAACAGKLADQDINRGLTQSQIRSFTGIPAAVVSGMSKVNKDAWSGSGVSVAEIGRSGQLVIRHGVTTQIDSIQNKEISIVREGDALVNLIQTALIQADLIGDPITIDTPMSIKAIIAGALETALASQIIQAYSDLLVRQQALPTGDPTYIQCSFKWQPTYPLNYIGVVLTLDLNTGSLTADSGSSSGNTG